MREGQNQVIRRADYQAPAFWIDTVDLTFDLDPAKTRVLNKMVLRRNPAVPAQALRQLIATGALDADPHARCDRTLVNHAGVPPGVLRVGLLADARDAAGQRTSA